jgi:hypothetical protein
MTSWCSQQYELHSGVIVGANVVGIFVGDDVVGFKVGDDVVGSLVGTGVSHIWSLIASSVALGGRQWCHSVFVVSTAWQP